MAKKNQLQSRKRQASSSKEKMISSVKKDFSGERAVNTTTIIIPQSPYRPAIVENKPIRLDRIVIQSNEQK